MKYANEINTEILATMGPTLGNKEQILRAVKLGVNNFRIHMGVRSRDRFQFFMNIRAVEKEVHRHFDLLIDLPSAKPRIGKMKSVRPVKGDTFKVIDAEQSFEDKVIPLGGLNKLLYGLKTGERVIFSDGKLIFKIVDRTENEITIQCENAYAALVPQISSCVFPESNIQFELFDGDDLEILHKMKDYMLCPDWIAISFASTIPQINAVKETIRSIWSENIKYMAKIENKEGIRNISELIEGVDGIMVARGDMLAFVEPHTLPYIQKILVEETRKREKTVVVATEMLERYAETGMICRPELSDIALAVRQGVSAVMLSVESSNSSRSEECISLMNKVILFEKEKLKNG